ncbi:flagellar hook assembly protein FlgD [Pseudooceanicola sp. CBS1P-1]|uniref:Basal-body rod modification protein FlgD n=1 Tax=Pseudooceanicola albus TaxID=2692189 RepID=A0A6L7G7S7_9RHOB|nr:MULTISPECIES: flagellar hook capping FlgD N-terminal domain-containing protein [Pseudooceanicola]MBT9385844.1 flagellar hook assembly protein FlgD [Pseudooceanicola endophyticus]MXN20075.1 flagellar basal body rod modification protein [Pseudooceanicola albus]
MADIQTTSAVAAAATSSSTASSVDTTAKPVISSDFETFLKMLSTQLKNQDPLNPVDSSDYAVQLATFSSVEQQVLTNNLLESLVSQMAAAGMSDLANWVGMEARSTTPAYFDGNTPVTVAPQIDTGADAAVLVVHNAAGTVVSRQEIAVGSDTIDWAGTGSGGATLSKGRYTFEVESYSGEELLSTTEAESYTPITEARLVGGQTMLITRGGDMVSASEIYGLRAPG